MAKATASRPAHLMPARSVVGRIRVSYPRILNLLVPLDFSGHSRQALRYAIPLARKFAARIALIHVLPRGTGRRAGGAGASAGPTPGQAEQRLKNMSLQLLPPALRGPLIIVEGSPATEILRTASRLNSDLIVLATNGRTGLKRFLPGGTAEQILRLSACPVFSIRRK